MGDFILAGWNGRKPFVFEGCGKPSLGVLRLGVPAKGFDLKWQGFRRKPTLPGSHGNAMRTSPRYH